MDNVDKTKTKVIVFTYKRNKVKEEDEYISFTYEFSGITEGYEMINEDDSLSFVDKNNQKFASIDDTERLDNELVYAFPTYLEGMDKEEKELYVNSVKDEKDVAEYFVLFQVYAKGSEQLVTYSMDPVSGETMDVDTTDHTGIDMMTSIKSNLIKELKESLDKNKSTDIAVAQACPNIQVVYANDMFDHISKTVICQDDQIRAISAAISKNLRITTPDLKDNLLVCGPSGVGKSEIFRCLSKYAGVPITMEDSTEYTAAGYVGKNVTDMLAHLVANSNGNIDRAQRGIVVIDEIDKKVSSNPQHEVYSKAVLDSLLKMAEGHTYRIDSKTGSIKINTSFITFVMAGAFSGIEEFSTTKRGLGFATEEQIKDEKDPHKNYTDKTLMKYGLKPEFLGRTRLVVMNNLGVDEFSRIISESDKSCLLLYKYLFEEMGINFRYDESTIEAIAKKAVKLGVGARSIKKIVETALDVINYRLFSKNDYKELIITPETIEDNTKFILR